MPAITEQPVSALTLALPTKLLLAVFIVAAIANIIYYMLPMRLTHTLVALLAKAEETYIEAHGMCLLSAAETQMLAALQLQILKESQLRTELNSNPRGVLLRRRGVGPR
ncbi:hypothetical protein B0H14DRAFT_2772767 [Mycena olivaceomarginata]|nr:hypothetical protein B0H14DRAFT_2772767 [Mycena olivaceomarginata]